MRKKIWFQRGWLYAALFVGIVGLDRLTKWWAVTVLPNRIIPVFPGINFELMWNRGVSWGLFGGASGWGFFLLNGVIALVIGAFILYAMSEYRQGRSIWFELMVLAGAISNFIDRLYYGAVVDFIDVYVYHGWYWSVAAADAHAWHWPTFNVADVCIVLGIGGVIMKGLRCMRQKK